MLSKLFSTTLCRQKCLALLTQKWRFFHLFSCISAYTCVGSYMWTCTMAISVKFLMVGRPFFDFSPIFLLTKIQLGNVIIGSLVRLSVGKSYHTKQKDGYSLPILRWFCFFKKIDWSFEHIDSWPKIVLLRAHHLWNSTTGLILRGQSLNQKTRSNEAIFKKMWSLIVLLSILYKSVVIRLTVRSLE